MTFISEMNQRRRRPARLLCSSATVPNPHYRPEVSAQCTIINLAVTPEGLEGQTTAMVADVEKSELEQQKQKLGRNQNESRWP